MADVEKRQHENVESNEKEDDEWIGPMPTEAIPTKKRKGLFNQSLFYSISRVNIQ